MINIQTLHADDVSKIGVYVNGKLVTATDADYFDEILSAVAAELRDLGYDVSYEDYEIEDDEEFEEIWEADAKGYPEEYPYL